jgi:chromosome segregation ATPase
MTKADLIKYVEKLELQNADLNRKLTVLESNISKSDIVTTLKSEIEDLTEKNSELKEKVENLEFVMEDKLLNITEPLETVFNSVACLAPSYSVLDNDLFFAKSTINNALVEFGLPVHCVIK